MTQLVGLGEQLLESLLDVVTNAIDKLGDGQGPRTRVTLGVACRKPLRRSMGAGSGSGA